MAAGDQYRLDVRGRYLEQLLVHTFYYLETGPQVILGEGGPIFDLGEGTLERLATMFALRMAAPFKAYCVDTVTFNLIRVTRLDKRRRFRRSFTLDIAWTGEIAEEGTPPQICAKIVRVCSPGTRAGNGRVFFSGIALSNFLDSLLIEAKPAFTQLTQLAIRMRETLDTGVGVAFAPGVVNPRVPTPDPQWTWYPIRSTRCLRTFGSQRHRAPGHGRFG